MARILARLLSTVLFSLTGLLILLSGILARLMIALLTTLTRLVITLLTTLTRLLVLLALVRWNGRKSSARRYTPSDAG